MSRFDGAGAGPAAAAAADDYLVTPTTACAWAPRWAQLMKPSDFVRIAGIFLVFFVSLVLPDHTITSGESPGPAGGRFPVPDAMALGGVFAFVFWSFVFESMAPIMFGPLASREIHGRRFVGGRGDCEEIYAERDGASERSDALVWVIFFTAWTAVRGTMLAAFWIYWRNASGSMLAAPATMVPVDPYYHSVLLILVGAIIAEKFWVYLMAVHRGAAAAAASFSFIFVGLSVYLIADGGAEDNAVVLLCIYLFFLLLLSGVTCVRAYQETDEGTDTTLPDNPQNSLNKLLRDTLLDADSDSLAGTDTPWGNTRPAGDGIPSLVPMAILVAFLVYRAIDTAGVSETTSAPSAGVADARTRAFGVDALPFAAFLSLSTWHMFDAGEYGTFSARVENAMPAIFCLPRSIHPVLLVLSVTLGVAQFLFWRNLHAHPSYVWGVVLGGPVLALAQKTLSLSIVRGWCGHADGPNLSPITARDPRTTLAVVVILVCAGFCSGVAIDAGATVTATVWLSLTGVMFTIAMWTRADLSGNAPGHEYAAQPTRGGSRRGAGDAGAGIDAGAGTGAGTGTGTDTIGGRKGED
jgi:hypothetical protein